MGDGVVEVPLKSGVADSVLHLGPEGPKDEMRLPVEDRQHRIRFGWRADEVILAPGFNKAHPSVPASAMKIFRAVRTRNTQNGA
jgi:hypothetical protein